MGGECLLGNFSKLPLTKLQLSTSKTPRRVEISEFKGSKLVNIREFYQKDDEYLPGKKVLAK